MFSLTLGLMGLDELHLRVLSASSDDPVERKNAQKGICPLSASFVSAHRFPSQYSSYSPTAGTGSWSYVALFHPLCSSHPPSQVLLLGNVVRTPSPLPDIP